MTMISDSSPGARGKARPPVRSYGEEIMRGREAEQQIIRDLLRSAQRGLGSVVLVEGEPGIGKSLLLHEAIELAAGKGFSLAAGASDQFGQAIPFFALRTALREPFTKLTADDPDRDLLEAPAWWISQIQAHLEQRAAAVPVLVCLDDLHWANPATLVALRTLPRDLKRHPIAWILARSNTQQHDAENLFGILEKDGAARVTLAALGDDAVAALLTDAFGALPDTSLLTLASGAAGNPSLLTELIHGLRDDNAVHVTGGRAVLASAQLPQRIHRVAQRRLDGLSKSARHLLVTAAVLGPSSRLEDAAEMLGETPTALLPAIEEAMSAGLMTAAESAFSFRHELLCRAVSDITPPPARKALHRQYGEILLNRGESPVLVARHLLKAAHPGDSASLADLDRAAAETVCSSPQTAADLAMRALELTHPSHRDVLSRSVAAAEALTAAGRLDQAFRVAQDTLAKPLPPVAEARLRCALSAILCARGRASDARAEAGVVLAQPQLPRDLRDQAMTAQLQAVAGSRGELAGTMADTILAAPSQYQRHAVVAALVTRAMISWDEGQIGEGLELFRDACRYGTGVSPDARHFQPLLALAAALVDLRQLDEAESILRSADDQALDGIPAQAVLSILRARIHMANGRLSDAAAAGQAALAIAETMGAHGYASTAHCILGVIALRRGDIAAATHHVASRSAPGPHFADTYARAETAMAQAQVGEGRDGPAAAIGRIRQVCADLPAHRGLLLGDPTTATWLIRTALAAGDNELAAIAARTAEALAADNPGFAPITAAVAHIMGLAGQDPAHLAEAAAQHHDPWAKASAAEDLGVLHARQGDRDRAVHHLEEALGGYQLTGATADMARIRRRLRKFGVRRRHRTQSADRPVSGWHSLTDAERAASELVAQGLSNRQAASRMYISSHTVAFYMRQAFRKLNISSRVELTRIVMQQSQQPATVNPMQGIAPQPPSLATRRSLAASPFFPGTPPSRGKEPAELTAVPLIPGGQVMEEAGMDVVVWQTMRSPMARRRRPLMSLSASDQQALDSIEATLTSSDPKLASLLAIFARLASGEEMPVRERIRIHRLQVTRGRQRKQRCSRPDKAGRHMRSRFRSLGWRRAGALMMCVLAFARLIAVPVINSHVNHEKCAHVRIAACVGHAQKAPSRAGSAGLRGPLEPAVLRVSDVRGAVKLNTRQGIDARLATLTTLAKAGQASWCSGEDWIQGGA